MKSLPLYFQMLGLEASNNSLLRQYEFLRSKREIREDLLLEELEERMDLRLTIKKELDNCIRETFQTQQRGILEGVFGEIFPLVFLANEKIDQLLSKISWDNCNSQERSNVRKYYDILYTPDLPRTVADLLLHQKSRVEGYMLGSPL